VFITGEHTLLEALKEALHALWAPSRCTFQVNQVQKHQASLKGFLGHSSSSTATDEAANETAATVGDAELIEQLSQSVHIRSSSTGSDNSAVVSRDAAVAAEMTPAQQQCGTSAVLEDAAVGSAEALSSSSSSRSGALTAAQLRRASPRELQLDELTPPSDDSSDVAAAATVMQLQLQSAVAVTDDAVSSVSAASTGTAAQRTQHGWKRHFDNALEEELDEPPVVYLDADSSSSVSAAAGGSISSAAAGKSRSSGAKAVSKRGPSSDKKQRTISSFAAETTAAATADKRRGKSDTAAAAAAAAAAESDAESVESATDAAMDVDDVASTQKTAGKKRRRRATVDVASDDEVQELSSSSSKRSASSQQQQVSPSALQSAASTPSQCSTTAASPSSISSSSSSVAAPKRWAFEPAAALQAAAAASAVRQARRAALAAGRDAAAAPSLKSALGEAGSAEAQDAAAAAAALSRVLRREDLAALRVVGQFNLGFIVARLRGDLFILDQHACDEKRNFEKLQRETVVHQQPLVRALPLETTAAEEAIIVDNLAVFQRNGFGLAVDEQAAVGRRLALTAVPFSKGVQFGAGDVHELASIVSEANER
jgi:DNA mismatch repair ATPase MutL